MGGLISAHLNEFKANHTSARWQEECENNNLLNHI